MMGYILDAFVPRVSRATTVKYKTYASNIFVITTQFAVKMVLRHIANVRNTQMGINVRITIVVMIDLVNMVVIAAIKAVESINAIAQEIGQVKTARILTVMR